MDPLPPSATSQQPDIGRFLAETNLAAAESLIENEPLPDKNDAVNLLLETQPDQVDQVNLLDTQPDQVDQVN